MPTDSGPREIGIGTAARLARRGAAPMLLGLTLLAAGVQPARPEAAAVAGRAAPYPIGMDLPSRLHARLVSPSGALQMTFRDIAVPARGWPLEFVRTYNSDNRWNSGLGAGWSWSYGIFLVPQGEAVTVRESDGLESRYTRAADGSWRPSDGRLDHVLRREAAGDYVRTYADGRGERFSPEGLLVERLGRSGVALTIAYEDKVPVRVTTPDGRGITIEWGPNGLIAALVDPLGRRTEFRYDQHDRPVRVTDGAKRWTAFIYDKKGLLVGVHAPPLGAVAAVYDVFDRVSFLLGPGLLQTRFEHEAGPGETDSRIVATDAEGRRTVLDLRRTADGSLVALTDGLGQRVAVSRQNRAARFTLPDGREAAMAFDEGGRASSFRDFTGKEQNLDAVRAAVQRFAPGEPAQRHDARGFPQTVEVDGETLTPRYDEIGRLTEIRDAAGSAERFHYDAADRLERHVDRTGRQTRYTYDWGDRVLSLVDARGLKTDFAYDPLGLREIRTEGQPTTTFDYDKSGLLLRTRAAGRQVSFEYDAARRITAIRDPHGNVTGFEYDALGNPTAVKTPNGRRTEFEYDSNGALAHVRDGANSLAFDRPAPGTLDIRRNRDRIDRAIADKDGLTTVTLYRGREVARSIRDWNGRVVAERQVGLGESRQEHDAAGRLVGSGASGRMVRYAHDANGRLESISAPDGDVWKLDYDAAGRLAGAASRAGPAFKLAYDAAGDLVSVEDARGARREAAYDKAGRLILQREALGETRYEYDARGRLTGLTAPDGARSTFAYDVDGRVAGRRLVSGNFRLEWQYGYDGFGALARIVHPDGVEEAREYDAFGRLAVQRIGAEQLSFAYDAEGRLVRAGRGKHNETFAYDPLGRLVAANGRTAFEYPEDGSPLASAEIDARGGRWLKRYDASGQLTALTDPGGAARRYEWSAGGLLRAQEDDDGRRIELARDAVGRLTGYGIRGGAAVRYEYDAAGALAAIGRAGRSVGYARDRLGRIASETTEGETARRYRYDALGRLVEVEDGLGKQVFTHGPGGELLSATDAFGRTIRYEYDAIGRRIALTGPGGERITYRYGPDGRVAAVGGADGETSLAADPASDSVRITLPGGDVLHASEDAHARLSALRLSGRDGTPLFDRRYERDAAGDILAVTQSERTWRYRYDAAGRLAEATDPDGQRESYHYDASGNIVGKGATKLTYDKAFRPTAIDADAVTHDADGNLAGLGDAVTLTHDAYGRVVSVRLESGELVRYRHDFRGRLVERRRGDAVTRYLYDGDQLIAAYDGEGRRLAWLERLPTAMAPVRVHTAGGVATLVVDEFGTPLASLGRDGRVSALTYSAWGEWRGGADPAAGLVGFAGALTDREAGIVFMGARAYLPALGRFTAPDPVGLAGGPHPYAYAANNPLRAFDPTGLNPESPFGPLGVRPRIGALPDIPGNVTPPTGDRPRDALRIIDYFERGIRDPATTPGARLVFQETLQAVYENKVALATHVRPPEPGLYGAVYNRSQPHVAHVFRQPHLADLARLGGGLPTVSRSLAGTAVHEVTHVMQALGRLRDQPTAVREFHADLRGHMADPRHIADSSRLQSPREALASLLNRANVDPEWRGGYREAMRQFRSALYAYQSAGYALAERGRIGALADEALNLHRDFRNDARLASMLGRAPERLPSYQPTGDMYRFPRPSAGALIGAGIGVAGAALNVYSYMNGHIGHGEFVFHAAVDAAAFTGLLPWPVAAALFCAAVGKLAGIYAAERALPEVMDPNSSYGRLIRAVFGLPPPPRARDFCTQAVNCDCEGINAGLLSGEWGKTCREREAAMIGKCRQAVQDGAPARAAVKAAGYCPEGTGGIHGPNYTPRPPGG